MSGAHPINAAHWLAILEIVSFIISFLAGAANVSNTWIYRATFIVFGLTAVTLAVIVLAQ